jgi:hypothetical protein
MRHLRLVPVVLTTLVLSCGSPSVGQWVQTAGPCTGKIYVLAIIETMLFAGTYDLLECPGVLYLSPDAGTHWSAANAPRPNWYVTSLAVNGAHLYAGGYGVAHSTDYGATWTVVNAGLTDKTVFCLAADGAALYAGTYAGVFLSTDHGLNWTLSLPTPDPIISLAVSGARVFAATRAGYNAWGTMWGSLIYRLASGDTNWARADSGLPGISKLAPLGACGSSLFVDTSPVTVGPPPPSSDESCVYRSVDNGMNWTVADSGLPYLVTCFAASGQNLFAGTQHGVYRSTDHGSTWSESNEGLANPHIVALAADQTHLFAGTDSGGVWRRPLAEMAVSVENLSGNRPHEFRLHQNYPNPFNPSTTIRYELPTSSMVTLSVYDILGNEVSVLVSERRDAGVHELKFDGAGLSSGVYFCRMRAGAVVQSRKLLLVR